MMNEIDKTLYKALKFFSKRTFKKIKEIKKKQPKKYKRHIPDLMEDALERARYVEFEDGNEEYTVITGRGLEQLRILENIKIKEKSILISIFALILSLFALAKSFGYI